MKMKVVEGKFYVWIKGEGYTLSKFACGFKPGEKMTWYDGTKSDVVKIAGNTECFTNFILKDANGKTYNRRLKSHSYIAIG